MTRDLVSVVPAIPIKDMKSVTSLTLLWTLDRFFEVHQYYATNGVVGFARINGQVVGIIANQPRILAGCLDINVSDKIARHIRFCDCFNIPIVTFMDVPGFLPGVQQEYGGIIRHGAKCSMLIPRHSAQDHHHYPQGLRRSIPGYVRQRLEADEVYAWPTAEIAVMGPEGAVNVIYRKEIAEAENPVEERKKLVQQYRERFANPYIASARGFIQDVIDPQDTRDRIINALQNLANKRETGPGRNTVISPASASTGTEGGKQMSETSSKIKPEVVAAISVALALYGYSSDKGYQAPRLLNAKTFGKRPALSNLCLAVK